MITPRRIEAEADHAANGEPECGHREQGWVMAFTRSQQVAGVLAGLSFVGIVEVTGRSPMHGHLDSALLLFIISALLNGAVVYETATYDLPRERRFLAFHLALSCVGIGAFTGACISLIASVNPRAALIGVSLFWGLLISSIINRYCVRRFREARLDKLERKAAELKSEAIALKRKTEEMEREKEELKKQLEEMQGLQATAAPPSGHSG